MQETVALHSTTDVVIRMADEGLPIRAIARALKVPSEEVREIVQEGVSAGVLLEYPKEDWPPSSTRNTRTPPLPTVLDDDNRLFLYCSRLFRTTRQQSIVLGMLLKRSEMTKEQLHQTVEFYRSEAVEQTNIKLVDVLICNMRRKLKPFAKSWYDDEDHEIITTMWGIGYLINPAERARAITALTDFINDLNEPQEQAA